MKKITSLLTLAFTATLLISCGKSGKQTDTEKSKQPVAEESGIQFGLSERDTPQIDYYGPGIMNYSNGARSFKATVTDLEGNSVWVTLEVNYAISNEGEITITATSDSTIPYILELLGMDPDQKRPEVEELTQAVQFREGKEKKELKTYVHDIFSFSP